MTAIIPQKQVAGLPAIESYVDFLQFGDGSDGNLVANSGTTTLARDTYYAMITLTGTAKIDVNGFRMYCSGICDIRGMPAGTIFRGNTTVAAGNGATAGTGGTAGSLTVADGSTLPCSPQVGVIGGAGGTAGGVQASAATQRTGSSGGNSGAGGTGGSGASGSGGAARAATPLARDGGNLFHAINVGRDLLRGFNTVSASLVAQPIAGGAGGPGGSGGGGDGTSGAGGGGGGGGGAGLFFAAKQLRVSEDDLTNPCAAGAIRAIGQNGGNGGSAVAGNRGGGGGASGGGGGFAMVVCGSCRGQATGGLSVDGGNGGNGGNGTGTGTGGDGGQGGAGGHCVFVNLEANIYETNLGTGASGGGAHSGTIGGTGSPGEQTRLDFH